LPAKSNAFAVIVYVRRLFPGTFHAQVYGDVVSEQVSVPFTKKSTFETPTLSDEEAFIVTVDLIATTEPFTGFVIDTVGAWVSVLVGVGVGERVGVAEGILLGVGAIVDVGLEVRAGVMEIMDEIGPKSPFPEAKFVAAVKSTANLSLVLSGKSDQPHAPA
jgi:hypothetical protein